MRVARLHICQRLPELKTTESLLVHLLALLVGRETSRLLLLRTVDLFLSRKHSTGIYVWLLPRLSDLGLKLRTARGGYTTLRFLVHWTLLPTSMARMCFVATRS